MKLLYVKDHPTIHIGRFFKLFKIELAERYWVSKVNGNKVYVSWNEESVNNPAEYYLSTCEQNISNGNWYWFENQKDWISRRYCESACITCKANRS